MSGVEAIQYTCFLDEIAKVPYIDYNINYVSHLSIINLPNNLSKITFYMFKNNSISISFMHAFSIENVELLAKFIDTSIKDIELKPENVYIILCFEGINPD